MAFMDGVLAASGGAALQGESWLNTTASDPMATTTTMPMPPSTVYLSLMVSLPHIAPLGAAQQLGHYFSRSYLNDTLIFARYASTLPSLSWMSSSTTSAPLRSRSVFPARPTAAAAAFSHAPVLAPTGSMALYTSP